MRLRKRKWMDPLINERKDLLFEEDRIDEALNFQKDKDIIIEIGSGKGGFIYQMAKKNVDKQFLGVEMQKSALAIALKNIEETKIDNLKFLAMDVAKVFASLKDNSISVIFLNFSDPWPKKRQHKRRLTYNTFLDEYYRILKKDGLLIFKTDNALLFEDSIKYLKESKFKLLSSDDNYDGNDEFDAQTEYETKFRALNTPIHRYIAKKD